MGRASEPVLACMRLDDDTLTKHNFYVDKFDTTGMNVAKLLYISEFPTKV